MLKLLLREALWSPLAITRRVGDDSGQCVSRGATNALIKAVPALKLIGHFNEYPLMHYFGIPSHIQSYKILTE